nr:unnamed protein product [Callosobruchus analis]
MNSYSSLGDLRPLLLSRKEASLQQAYDKPDYESRSRPPKVAKRSSGSRLDVLEPNDDEMKKQEPATPCSKPHIAEWGVKWLGQLSYNKVKYEEVLKKLQAALVFSALRRFPRSSAQEHLVKFDTALETIIHGLEREAFAIKANLQEKNVR